uniref:Uncharacterized protein n=1 Tax=Ascaris lumbricoides TaxID=6252 RepID=A0A9J2PEL8_ASCLU
MASEELSGDEMRTRLLMWIAIFMGTVLLQWNSTLIMAEKKCSKSNFEETLRKPDAILYGMREDGAVLFATIADILAIDRDKTFEDMLGASFQGGGTKREVLIMDVGGLPQLFISRLSAANSIPGVQMNRLDLVHLVDYPIALNPLNKYHILSLIKDYSSKEVVLLSLFNPGDAYYFNVEHSAREDILFGHKDGSGIRTRILLKRNLRNVEVVGYIREPVKSGDTRRFTGSSIITAVRDASGFKWVVRDQFALKSVIYQCVVKTTQDFFMNILYNRRQKLIDGITRAKNAAIYYPLAPNAQEFNLERGSIIVLARRGWLCSLRVTTDGRLPVLLERLARTFPCHPAAAQFVAKRSGCFLCPPLDRKP